MTEKRPTAADWARFRAKQEEMIRRHGYMVIMTGIETPAGILSMAYTVGLAQQGKPELIVFALPPNIAHSYLNNAAAILTAGRLEVDVPQAEIGGNDVVLKRVPSEATPGYLNQAIMRAGGPVEALQIVWPDPRGLFPWEDGFDRSMRLMQPPLYNMGTSQDEGASPQAPQGPTLH